MSQNEWVEPRGPHLPDAITRIPPGVWPFLALAALAAYGRWIVVTSNGLDHPVDLLWAVPTTVQHVAAPLLGAALFYRHPRAHRTIPAVAFAAVLFAFTTVVDALREPVLTSVAQPPTFGSLDESFSTLAGSGYSVVEALIGVFAVTYLAIGLADARRFEHRDRQSIWLVVLVAAALGSAAVNGLLAWPWIEFQVLPFAIAIGSQALANLAWAYLGWTALRGSRAREEPRHAWILVAVAGIGYVSLAVVGTLLSGVVWLIGPTESQVPLVFELGQLLGAAFAGIWLALLAAFWLGLPDEPVPEAVDATASA